MTDLLDFHTAQQIIKSNNPFPLDAPDRMWMVKDGTMAIFAIATTNGSPQGTRRYLYSTASICNKVGVLKRLL